MNASEKILTNVREWNKWREKFPKEIISLENIDFSYKDLSGCDFSNTTIVNVNFDNAILLDCKFTHTNIVDSSFKNAKLNNSSFAFSELSQTTFEKASISYGNLASSEIRDSSFFGVDFSNTLITASIVLDSELSQTNFMNSDLSGSIFNNCNLTSSDFTLCAAEECDFKGSTLLYANLTGVNFRETDLRAVELSDAILCGADLRHSKLDEADLSRSTLTGVKIWGISFTDWTIDGVICESIFRDKDARIPYPQKRSFELGEFEKNFKSLPHFELVYESGLELTEVSLVAFITKEVQKKYPYFQLEIKSIDNGFYPSIKFTVQEQSFLREAIEQIVNHRGEELLKIQNNSSQIKIISHSELPQLLEKNYVQVVCEHLEFHDQSINIYNSENIRNITSGNNNQVTIGKELTSAYL